MHLYISPLALANWVGSRNIGRVSGRQASEIYFSLPLRPNAHPPKTGSVLFKDWFILVGILRVTLVSEWVSEWVSQEVVRQWVIELVSHWVSESVSHWVSESVSQRVSEAVSQRVSESASQRVSESVSQWISESQWGKGKLIEMLRI